MKLQMDILTHLPVWVETSTYFRLAGDETSVKVTEIDAFGKRGTVLVFLGEHCGVWGWNLVMLFGSPP